MLVTSRRPLQVAAERVIRLGPIAAEDGALLFEDRAQRVAPSFRLTDDNRDQVESLVRKLDGMSLAIELAAARVHALGVDQLVSQLTKRLQVLVGGHRDKSARQRSLRAAIDWSWELLTPVERLVLAQCSVIRVGYTVADAEAVVSMGRRAEAGWVVDVVQTLIDHSLIEVEQSQGEVRYTLLESIRLYSDSRLRMEEGVQGDVGELEKRYVSHYAGLGEWSSLLRLKSPVGQAHLRLLVANNGNLRRSFTIARKRGWGQEAGLCACALAETYTRHGPLRTGYAILVAALEMPSLEENLRGRLYLARGVTRGLMGGDRSDTDQAIAYEIAQQTEDDRLLVMAMLELFSHRYESTGNEQHVTMLQRAYELAKSADLPDLQAAALSDLGWVYRRVVGRKRRSQAFQQAVDLFCQCGDRFGEAKARSFLGSALKTVDSLGAAVQETGRALQLSRELGYTSLEAHSWVYLGNILHRLGRLEQSIASFQRSRVIARRTGLRWLEPLLVLNIGNIYLLQGSHKRALKYIEGGLKRANELGNRLASMYAIGSMAQLAFAMEDYERSEEYFQEALRQSKDYSRVYYGAYLAAYARLRSRLGATDEAFSLLDSAEQELRESDVTEYVKARVTRGLVLAQHGETAAAREVYDYGKQQAVALQSGKLSGLGELLKELRVALGGEGP